VRAAAEDETLPVPSPTFLLQNIYDELEGAQPLGSGPVALKLTLLCGPACMSAPARHRCPGLAADARLLCTACTPGGGLPSGDGSRWLSGPQLVLPQVLRLVRKPVPWTTRGRAAAGHVVFRTALRPAHARAAGTAPRQPAQPAQRPGRAAGPPVHHFDLYRLGGPADLARLALGASFAGAVALVEWAERLGPGAPPARLDVHFAMLPDVRHPPF